MCKFTFVCATQSVTVETLKTAQKAGPVVESRTDLDMADQQRALDEAKAQQFDACVYNHWLETCSSRGDHRHMLRSLLIEAYRYQQRMSLTNPKKVVTLPLTKLRMLLRDVDILMKPEAPKDNYAHVLTELSKLSLFNA